MQEDVKWAQDEFITAFNNYTNISNLVYLSTDKAKKQELVAKPDEAHTAMDKAYARYIRVQHDALSQE